MIAVFKRTYFGCPWECPSRSESLESANAWLYHFVPVHRNTPCLLACRGATLLCRLISLSQPAANSSSTLDSLFSNRHEMRTSAQKRWLILNRPNEIENQSSLTRILPPAV